MRSSVRQAKNGDRAFTQSPLLEINVDGTEEMTAELLAQKRSSRLTGMLISDYQPPHSRIFAEGF